MKAEGLGARLPFERRRQQMLSRMLLHVIEAPVPIDVPAHARVRLELAIDQMADSAVFLVEHIENHCLADRAGVEGLAAGRRVEGCAIEDDLPAVVLPADLTDDGVEFDQVGIGVVEAFRRHGPPVDPLRRLLRIRARAAHNCRSGRTACPAGRGRNNYASGRNRGRASTPRWMICALVIFISGAWMRNWPPSTPAFVASFAVRSKASMYSGRQSG